MSEDGLGVKVGRGVIYALGLLFLAFLFLMIASRYVWLILLPFHLICGWFIHASKALPHLFGKWQEAILPMGCLLMASVIAHRFVRRWVDEKFPDRTWRIRHTAGALSLLLLGSAAAIAASGVVHQMFWLASGKVIKINRWTELTEATSNGRQLMMALTEYRDTNGRYPDSFEQLAPEMIRYTEVLGRLSWLESRDGTAPEPWILLKPLDSDMTTARVPVIVSPILNSGEISKVVVGYSDGSVSTIYGEQLKGILDHARRAEGGGGR
jgi:hypothetical protein